MTKTPFIHHPRFGPVPRPGPALMGKKRQVKRPFATSAQRGVRRIAQTLDSALRESLNLPPSLAEEPYPVPVSTALAFLTAVLEDEKEVKSGGHAGERDADDVSLCSSPEDGPFEQQYGSCALEAPSTSVDVGTGADAPFVLVVPTASNSARA